MKSYLFSISPVILFISKLSPEVKIIYLLLLYRKRGLGFSLNKIGLLINTCLVKLNSNVIIIVLISYISIECIFNDFFDLTINMKKS